MKTTLILIVFFLMSINLFSAQRVAKLYMKSGSIISGVIIDDTKKEEIILQFKDASKLAFKYSDIERYEVSIDESVIELKNDKTNSEAADTNAGIWNYIRKGIDIQLFGFDFDYKEELELPKKSTESGTIFGFDFGISSNRNHSLWLTLNLSFAKADETYDGSTMEGQPVKTTTTSTFFRFTTLVGYDFRIDDNFVITPFVGIDFRSWDRLILGTGGMEELYSWKNIPLGLKLDFQMFENFRIGISDQYNIMFDGNIDVLYSKYYLNASDVSLKLGNVTGNEISIPMSYDIFEKFKLICTPYYERYEFHKSNIKPNSFGQKIYEPSSKTINWGIKTGIIVLF